MAGRLFGTNHALVYRARDTKLADTLQKLQAANFADDQGRFDRIEWQARLLTSVNVPPA